MKKNYSSYEKLVPTKSLLDLPVTDIPHVIKEINKQRHTLWRIKETSLQIKERQLQRKDGKI